MMADSEHHAIVNDGNVIHVNFRLPNPCPTCRGWGRTVVGQRQEGVAHITTTRRCGACDGLGQRR